MQESAAEEDDGTGRSKPSSGAGAHDLAQKFQP